MLIISVIEDIQYLNKRVQEIMQMGWINSHSKNWSSCGILFEKLIGKEVENFEIPDFGNIEIKTKCSTKEEYVTLFSANPDRCLFEIEKIRDKYGYPDKQNKNFKVFNLGFYGNKYKRVSNQLAFRIEIDYQNKEVLLCSRNNYNKETTIITSWTFDMLEEKLNRKLRYLLMIDASKMMVNNCLYYKYYNYNFYKLKGFETFIKLIELGYVTITFKIGVFRYGRKYGQTHNHGTSFAIKEKDLELLFSKININHL